MPNQTQDTNPGTGAPRQARQEPNVKQKVMDTAPVTSLAQVDVTKPISRETRALIQGQTASSSRGRGTPSSAIKGYYPGMYQQHTTFKVSKSWGLSKIAKHLGVTVEALKAYNKDKLKYYKGVAYFLENEAIAVPPQNKPEDKKRQTETEQEERVEITVSDERQSEEVSTSKMATVEEKGSAVVPVAEKEKEIKKDPELKEEKEETGESTEEALIGSWIGKVPQAKSKDAPVNLPADVKKVQDKLKELQLLSEEDYARNALPQKVQQQSKQQNSLKP